MYTLCLKIISYGIPLSCTCIECVIEHISKSDRNTFRRYYRCHHAVQRKLVNDNHIFKWVDMTFSYEILQLDMRTSTPQSDYEN
ncbi:hypothetical protein N665_0072s0050 [Sinapis alba]|nr:hypothetical protein N665_0072s0050 [Sinapis alba]